MNLQFNKTLVEGYKSPSQITRVLTEDWVRRQAYCPSCGNSSLLNFSNNKPVADFYCQSCHEQYELKSKKDKLGKVINDGAYKTMIQRINSDTNPNFFFLTYSQEFSVNDFLIIPKHFFTTDIIIKRPPLSKTTRRAGWVGCNIDLNKIPELGKVFIVKNQQVVSPSLVSMHYQKTTFLSKQKVINRGWTLEVMKLVDELPINFKLNDLYNKIEYFQSRYPNNNNIEAKIRQQLQILRDKEIIKFLGNGKYRKLT